MRRIHLACVLLAALAACGNVKNNPDAPPPPIDAQDTDAQAIDAGVDAMNIDARIDAPPPLPGQELNGASGRLTGPTFTMDVQLGHPTGQQQVQSGTYRLEANTPIKP